MRILLVSIFIGICCLQLDAAKIETVFVQSKCMHKKIGTIIILPDADVKASKKYPVVYLLHGAGDNYTGWLSIEPDIASYADLYSIIIVCVDGGSTSWYFDSPVDPKYKYETYISKELVKYVDSLYPTIANKSNRAITGLSMGGHGALYLAIRNQRIWGAAGSISGGVDFRPFKNNWDLPKRLGPYSTHQSHWENNTVTNMLPLLHGSKMKIIFDCGTEDFFHEGNKKLHEKMLQKNIVHEYSQRPGAHTSDYWRNSLKFHLAFFNKFFKKL